MNYTERGNYLSSLKRKLKASGFFVYKYKHENYMSIQRNICDWTYLWVKIQYDESLVVDREVRDMRIDWNERSVIETNIKIDQPHYDNLVKIMGLYCEHGGGNNPNNPTLEELLNITKCQTKSARNI